MKSERKEDEFVAFGHGNSVAFIRQFIFVACVRVCVCDALQMDRKEVVMFAFAGLKNIVIMVWFGLVVCCDFYSIFLFREYVCRFVGSMNLLRWNLVRQ